MLIILFLLTSGPTGPGSPGAPCRHVGDTEQDPGGGSSVVVCGVGSGVGVGFDGFCVEIDLF